MSEVPTYPTGTNPLKHVRGLKCYIPSFLLKVRGTTRAEEAQGTPTQTHISPSILVNEDYS